MILDHGFSLIAELRRSFIIRADWREEEKERERPLQKKVSYCLSPRPTYELHSSAAADSPCDTSMLCVCGCICVLDCIIPFLMIPFSSLMFALSPYHPVCTSECFWGFTFHRRVKGATVCVQRAVPSLCCLLWILHQWIPLPPRTLYTCVCVCV